MMDPPGGMILAASCVVQKSAYRFVRMVVSKSSLVSSSKDSKNFW